MPSSPSAIKRLKQSQKRRMHNRITKKVIKTLTKRTMASLVAKEFEKAGPTSRRHGQDRQGGSPTGPPPEHRRTPQE